MEIIVRKTGIYRDLQIIDGNTTIDLGLLDKGECRELSSELADAVVRLSE